MLVKDRQKIIKNTSYDWISHEEFCFNTSLQNRILCWTLGIPALSDAVVASLMWVLSPVKRERPHHLHDRWHVWNLQNKVGISFSNRWSLPSGQLGARDCILAYCLEYILNFTGSLDYAAVFVSPLQHLVHRHSGHVASPGPSSALCWCLGSDPSVSQEDLGMMTSTGRRIYDVDNYVNDLSMYMVIMVFGHGFIMFYFTSSLFSTRGPMD